MPNWNEMMTELKSGGQYDVLRRKYLKKLHELTGRNVIAYYSGWLQRPDARVGIEINDEDKNGFMSAINKMDRKKGLDIILHTPGGETAATESLVDYLKAMFGTDIRAIVPQLSLSAGTMIACACKEIVMGKHSSLGPIDPQLGGIPAHGIKEEFYRAYQEIKADQIKIAVWQPIIAKYNPTLIGECEKAIAWSEELLKEWLKTGMFNGQTGIDTTIANIVKELGDHALTKAHDRHLSISKCTQIGLKVKGLEDSQELQEAVLSVHHAFIHTLSSTDAIKIIENQNGTAFVKMIKSYLVS